MVRYNNTSCLKFEVYYFDYLRDKERVPFAVREHMDNCANCRGEIEKLKNALQSQSETDAAKDDITAYMLGVHMSFADKPLDCKSIRPFLATLADLYLDVEALTPITAHIRNCPQCREQLEDIRRLGLSSKQLQKLSILSSVPDEKRKPDREKLLSLAESIAKIDLKKRNDPLTEEVFRNPDTSDYIYTRRQQWIEALTHTPPAEPLPCESIEMTTLFDLAVPVPSEANPKQPMLASIAQHVRTCPKCLRAIQQIHEKVTELLYRDNSGVITVFESQNAESENPQPVVRVLTPQNSLAASTKTSRAKNPAGTSLISLAGRNKYKFIFAAAAAVLIVLSIFPLFTNSLQAVSIEEVSSRMKKLDTFRTIRIDPLTNEVVSENYYSRSMKIYAIRRTGTYLLYDLKEKKATRYINGRLETIPIPDNQYKQFSQILKTAFTSLPVSAQSSDTLWQQTDPNTLNAQTAPQVEVYDLRWTTLDSVGGKIQNLRRYFIDSETKVPLEIHKFRQWGNMKRSLPETITKIEILDRDRFTQLLDSKLKQLTE